MTVDTLCVQGGWSPKKGEPRQVPVYSSTTFRYETSEQMADLFDLKASGYFYTRLAKPTNDQVAKKIAALEGGVAAILTASGQAASTFAVLNLCRRIPRTCKVTITRAGLGDYTCPPSGVAILYNNMTCPKQINWMQNSTHGYLPPTKYRQTFTLKQP